MSLLIKDIPWNKKLEILRVVKGWSQDAAGEKCCTNKKGYWNWESGKNYPRKNSRSAIARAFGVKEEEIFEVEEKKDGGTL